MCSSGAAGAGAGAGRCSGCGDEELCGPERSASSAVRSGGGSIADVGGRGGHCDCARRTSLSHSKRKMAATSSYEPLRSDCAAQCVPQYCTVHVLFILYSRRQRTGTGTVVQHESTGKQGQGQGQRGRRPTWKTCSREMPMELMWSSTALRTLGS